MTLCLACGHQIPETRIRPLEDPVAMRLEPASVEMPTSVLLPAPFEKGLVRIAFVTPSGRPAVIFYQPRSRSVGSPTRGHLEFAKCLPASGPGFITISKHRCATDETIAILLFAIGELMKEFPGSPPVVIGALSKENGGRIRPHKSHRSGRDVDIGYFAVGNRPLKGFENLHPDEIDYDKTFYLMALLIATGRVDFIFVNYALQGRFIEAARRMGYDEDQIKALFQYPKGRRSRSGIIRHARGHMRHFHVRFACPHGNSDCIPD